MILLLVSGVAGLAIYSSMKSKASGSMKRLYDLADTTPEKQGGNFKRDYDIYFDAAANEFGVPFALLKAHAFRESSFNARAFRDENPTGRTDRIGWASRGLMQLLFWPKSDRFAKYGFAANRNPDDLFDPNLNIRIAAQLIRDNLKASNGNIRDAVNMYNAGVKESVRKAPHNYVDNVLSTYQTLLMGAP